MTKYLYTGEEIWCPRCKMAGVISGLESSGGMTIHHPDALPYIKHCYVQSSDEAQKVFDQLKKIVDKAKVVLFKPDGKYYTEEEWRIPDKAIGPYDMERSPDFRRISGGPVLVETQEPWGYPHLFPSIQAATIEVKFK